MSGAGGNSPIRNVTITVTPLPAPTLTLSANPATINSGQQSVLTWNTSNATACTASGGWSGAKNVNGSETVGPLTQTTTYTLNCTGAGGSVNRNATVTVNGGSESVSGSVDSSYVDRFGDNRVYVFSGNVTPDDDDGDAGDPLTTIPVTQNANACSFRYGGGNLAAGTYTIAFTQDAAVDVPDQANTLVFVGTRQITVASSGVTSDFRPSPILTVGPGRQFATLRDAQLAAYRRCGHRDRRRQLHRRRHRVASEPRHDPWRRRRSRAHRRQPGHPVRFRQTTATTAWG